MQKKETISILLKTDLPAPGSPAIRRPLFFVLSRILSFLFTLSFIMICCETMVFADTLTQRRILAGLDLFPSFLAADRDIEQKKRPDGTLLLMLLTTAEKEATDFARHLESVRQIRNMPVYVEILPEKSFKTYDGPVPAGIFLARRIADLNPVIRYSRKHSVMLISPFKGDFEWGVTGGIYISDRILPHINVKAALEAGIRIKPFFLRVAHKYE